MYVILKKSENETNTYRTNKKVHSK